MRWGDVGSSRGRREEGDNVRNGLPLSAKPLILLRKPATALAAYGLNRHLYI